MCYNRRTGNAWTLLPWMDDVIVATRLNNNNNNANASDDRFRRAVRCGLPVI